MKLTWILESIFIACVALYVFSSLYSVFSSSRESIRYSHSWSRARVGALFANIGIIFVGALGCLKDTEHVRKELDLASANVTAICLIFGSVVSISWTIISQPCVSQAVYELVSWIIWTLLFTLSSPYYWAYGVISALYLLSLIMSLALPWPSSSKDARHPLSNSRFIPSLTVSWLDHLITLAASGTLSSDDAWPIDSKLSVRSVLARRGLQPDQLRQSLSAGLVWVLLREFRSPMCLSAIFGIINVATALAQPFLLRSLLQNRDMFSVAGLFAATVASGTTEAHLKLQLSKIGVQFRSAMTALIADRCISSTNIDIHAKNADPTLLIEVDTTKVYELVEQFHLLWMIPLQAGISVVALVLLLGWQSVLAGFLSPAVFLPLISYTTSSMSTHMALVMQAKDATVSLVTQVLKQVKQVKLNSLENIFERKIADRRAEEMERTKVIALLNGVIVFLVYNLPPALISIAFGVALFLGHSLSSNVVFPALAFSSNITRAISLLPHLVILYQSAQISFGRIKTFLLIDPSPERLAPSPTSLSSTSIINSKGKLVFSMRHCDISLPTAQGGFQPIIRDCNIETTSNCLLVISGSVGCGKTTLIRSIIGDIMPTRGQFSIHGRIAYAPQKPYLTSGTIRDNILFGLPFDPSYYQRVLEAVSLSSDLSRLPQGDETPMGGTGATLSGGQKSRVGLARAIYARREVIVLDDPLAALDAQVQSHIIAQVLGPDGILKDSLRITTTSSAALMSIADKQYNICDGTVARTASPAHTQTTQTLNVLATHPKEIHGSQRQPPLVANYGSIKSNTSMQITPCDSDADQESAPLLQKAPLKVQCPDMGSDPVRLGNLPEVPQPSQLFDILAVYYLKLSSEDFESQGHSTKLFYYSICALIGGSLSMLFVLVAFYVCIIPTSLSIHAQLTKGVLEAKFSFFDTHSLGQILNRFTNDINKIDTSVNGSFISLSALCITTSSSLFVMISVTPLSLLYLVPTAIVYFMIQSHYLHACRQLRRLDNLARAPVLNQAAETRLGAQVIVTFNQVDTFRERVRDVIDDHIRVWAPYVMLKPWLTLRLQLLSSVLQLLSASLLLWLNTSPSTLGLAMNFLIQITSNLNSFVQIRATLEADITSAERVWSYAANVPESQPAEEQRPAPSWPDMPVINFESYSASYAAGGVPCLRDLSFSIAAGEHVAVVGRTGAGKSSLSLALLRALEQGDSYNGRITIDGLDISKICLADLRNRITFLPQEPFVFAGTIRHNLDFAGTETDERLQEALSACQMSRFFNLEPAQNLLDYPVSDSGSNLSSGQIQLLALSRALVAKGNNILIMDEATAAMDSSTTAVIHDVIQKFFKDYTHEGIQHEGVEVVSSVKYAVRRGNLYDWVGDSTPEASVKMIAGHESKFSLVI
ncbi:AAA ATPase domain [Fusarium oxysporum f. sp. vasinfectum]|nr:AAA ATPase domain [Fusarium oxysporum f. sp. vasinfectum]